MINKFKKLQIDALEEFVEQNKYDHTVLIQIDKELISRRTRKRNSALRNRIQDLLDINIHRIPSNTVIAGKNQKINKPIKVKKSPSNMKRESTINYPNKFLVSAFEGMRQKLLDISGGRSRLLHLEQNSRSFVRIVDELPNELAKTILSDKPMLITPVPEPTLEELIKHGYLLWDEEEDKHIQLKNDPDAKEWAAVIGIDNGYELPKSSECAQDGRHTDSKLQSLLFESGLNFAVKKLAGEAKTAIEETGNNILFLCLGFLEWVDQADNTRKRLAPLYMLPISINKNYNNGVAVYSIQYNGEDIIQNLILREKLQQEFGLALPDVMSSESDGKRLTPEEYFEVIEDLLSRKTNDLVVRNWKVRRFATLATLSLGKLLMYRDLDPRNWPSGKDNLLEHNVIKKFFQDGSRESSGNCDNQSYVLDNIKNLHESYPMIEDADSSQMSVLIDVLDGKNLVVEGPPGTGKSQTITNIISAALSQNKTVLFVAEKQAALQVVKRRMDKAGLGDFCLDLHSDKAQKRQVLDSFKQRISNASTFIYSHRKYLRELERYERAREKLQHYVEFINQSWKHTGLTIHEILMAASRYEKTIFPLKFKVIKPENVDGQSFNKVKLDEKLEQLELFYNYLKIVSKQLPETGNWSSHPWFGVTNRGLSGQDPDEVIDNLKSWNSQLNRWNERVLELCNLHNISFNDERSIYEAESLVSDLAMIPLSTGKIDVKAISKLPRYERCKLAKYVENHKSLALSFAELRETFTKEVIDDVTLLDSIAQSNYKLGLLGINKNIRFDDLTKEISKFNDVIHCFERIRTTHSELAKNIPDPVLSLLGCNTSGLRELQLFISLTSYLPEQYVSLRNTLFDNELLLEFTLSLSKEYTNLVSERDELNDIFFVDKLPSEDKLYNLASELENTGLFSWLRPSWREAKKSTIIFSRLSKFNEKEISKSLLKAAEWTAKHTSFIQSTKNNKLLGDYFQGLDTDIDQLVTLANWYKRVRTEYGIGFGRRVVLANTLFSLSSDIFMGVQNLSKQGMVIELEAFLHECKELASVFTSVDCLVDHNLDLSVESKPLNQAYKIITTNMKNCQQYLVNPNTTQARLHKNIVKCISLKNVRDLIVKDNLCTSIFSEKLNLKPLNTGKTPEDLQVIVDTMRYAQDIENTCKNESIIHLIMRQDDMQSISTLKGNGRELVDQKIQIEIIERIFLKSIRASREQWFKQSGSSLQQVIARNNLAIENGIWLDGWIKYLFAKHRMELGGFTLLNKYLNDNPHSLNYAKNAMKFAAYQSLAREIYQEQPELSQMSGHEQTALQKQFATFDDQLKDIQRKRVASLAASRDVPPGTRGARAMDYTNRALLAREIEKKTKHISVRNLVTRAGDAMIAYKPCFMMSPMAVAKYIPPGSLTFDIVVMDEASQVKPQDALSCFARGKQIVVVGDSKQLPPTSFFEKSVSNDTDDEETGVIDEAESILDAVGAYFDKRQLRWHYRSRHESLIEFSNHKFYNGNLVVFPSPWNHSDDHGIKFKHVANGRFINNVNQTESLAVVDGIREHLINGRDESLGIVAMNSKQRDLIEADLESAISKDPILRSAYLKNLSSEDPIFIKNLENVQGDERDVIYISFTYGPKEKGALSIPQRFGPINGVSGWRRLNVLFTRAKIRIQAFSSMTADQIVLSDTSSLGVKSLKGYLQFAQTGQLIGQDGIQEGEPDSDFEVAVMDMLSKHGFECVPQVGVAGFFIDIAVRDPGMPGRYLMGIECDGATYHSSKSTRDRDRVRQSVLEGLGWTIRRVWSTDWFKHSEGELKPIIDELKSLSTPVKDSQQPEDDDREDSISELPKEPNESAAETLKDALIRYRDDVIAKKYPNTEPNKKLLRADIIERLVMDRPMTKDEFLLRVPGYLRENTCIKEATDYLDYILEIITDYESIE